MAVQLTRNISEGHAADPVEDPDAAQTASRIRRSIAQSATIGIFVLLLIISLYFSRALLLPITAAAVISIAFGPLMRKASACGIPRWLTTLVLVGAIISIAATGITLLAAPLAEWVGRAPEIGAAVRQKLHVFDAPLAAFRELQDALGPSSGGQVRVESQLTGLVLSAVTILTPAVTELVLFVVSLVFLLMGQLQCRRLIVSVLPHREAKLHCLKIFAEVESNIATQLAIVSAINICIGLVVTCGAWAIGFPNPYIFGILAAILNYVPYIGPAIMVATLFAVGIVLFPTLSQALIAPVGFVIITAIEGQFVTPAVLGRNLTISPLTIFLAVAFWAWLWGPFGAFLAVPLCIIGLVTMEHVFPDENPELPD
jgi:predicted PurR-regulated permease PerM